MLQPRLPRPVHERNDPAILRDHVLQQGVRRQQRRTLEPQVVAHAAHRVGVAEARQETLPQADDEVADAPVQLREQLRVVREQQAQVLVADQVLADLEHAVADAAHRLHPGRQFGGHGLEPRRGVLPVDPRQVRPRVGVEVRAALDCAPAAGMQQRAAAGQDVRDADLVRHRVVGHLPEEAVVDAEEFAPLLDAAADQVRKVAPEDLLHRLRVDQVLVERQPPRLAVPRRVDDVTVVGRKGDRHRRYSAKAPYIARMFSSGTSGPISPQATMPPRSVPSWSNTERTCR